MLEEDGRIDLKWCFISGQGNNKKKAHGFLFHLDRVKINNFILYWSFGDEDVDWQLWLSVDDRVIVSMEDPVDIRMALISGTRLFVNEVSFDNILLRIRRRQIILELIIIY